MSTAIPSQRRRFSVNRPSQNQDDRVTPGVMDEMLRWLDNSGSVFRNSVEVQWSPDSGYRLVAKRPIAAGETVVSLPSDIPLSIKKGDPAYIHDLCGRIPSELWGVKLGLRLLLERTRVSGIPIFFSREELHALQYPPVIQQVTLRSRFLNDFTNQHLSSSGSDGTFEGLKIDMNALGWGMAAVLSRAFSLSGGERAMLPLIDLCNHSFTPNCKVKPKPLSQDGGFTIDLDSILDISKGDELFIKYGKSLTNDDLLLDYGFVDENNPNDSIDLAFNSEFLEMARVISGLSHSSLQETWRANALNVLKIAQGDTVKIGGQRMGGTTSRRSIPGVAVQDLQSLEFGDGKISEKRIDQEALKTIAGVSAMCLGQFPTTLEEDLKWLEKHHHHHHHPENMAAAGSSSDSEAATANMVLAVHFRVAKKRSLARVLEVVKEEIRSLE
eukprot:jgi/Bigna1/135435/aug1.29_g10143